MTGTHSPLPARTKLQHICTTAKNILSNLLYMYRTQAPWRVYSAYLRGLFGHGARLRYQPAREAFSARMSRGQFSNDWFTTRIPYWLEIFARHNLPATVKDALEIGSWEGSSSLFLLENLPNAHLTCVDTWGGADEHKGQDVLNRIEQNFDANLSPHQTRLTKFKGTSLHYYASAPASGSFDLIYVDGSHHCDEVMLDALKCFDLLKVGGIMIFDDYMWRYYRQDRNNPAIAINYFLRMKRGSYRLVSVYYQLVLVKTGESPRS